MRSSTRLRVLKAIRKLDYRPNTYARRLARGRSSMLGVIISDITNPFFAEIAQIVELKALEHNYEALICSTQFSTDRLRRAVERMIGMRVDGLVIMTSEINTETIESVRSRRLPVVFEDVGNVDEHTTNLRIDYEGGISLAVRRLVELGHRSLLFVENHPAPLSKDEYLSVRLRSEGFWAAIKQFPGVRARALAKPGEGHAAGLEIAARALQRFDFTGVIANCDPVALGLLRGFRRAGLQVPRDVSLIGFDNSPMCELTDPPLTSVAVSRNAIGSAAVEVLLDMIELKNPGREILIPADLILRESIGRCSQPSITSAGCDRSEKVNSVSAATPRR